MEEYVVENAIKNLNCWERIVVRIFKKVFVKVCEIIRIDIVNVMRI